MKIRHLKGQRVGTLAGAARMFYWDLPAQDDTKKTLKIFHHVKQTFRLPNALHLYLQEGQGMGADVLH